MLSLVDVATMLKISKSQARLLVSTGKLPGVPVGGTYRVSRQAVRDYRAEREVPMVDFLTVGEVASLMRVSKMTVYRLVHSSELPSVRVGRSFRVPMQAVVDYLSAQREDRAVI